MTRRLFGTDGIRGLAGSELTEDLANRLGRAAVRVLGGQGARPAFVVGRDPRASGEWLEDALVAGIRSAGGDACLAGVQPTPAVAFLATQLGASSGVVISASHNPPEYNGIKFFDAAGSKLSDRVEDAIEAALGDAVGTGRRLGEIVPVGDAAERYLSHLVDGAGGRLDGMRVVVDCANGSASHHAPELLRRLGADVVAIHAEPDGSNINDGCGALYPEVVADEVVRLAADAGVSHDGDADRALFADAEGSIVDGDQVLAACAVDLHGRASLPADTVVTTIMANLGFHQAMADAGINVVSSKVGDRYVLEDMVRTGAGLGGEQSGHVIFRDRASTGDGLLTAARFLVLAARTGRSVRDVASVMHRYPQRMINVEVADGSVAEAERVARAVAEAEAALGADGRVLVRPSGTEPIVRVMVEAASEDLASHHAERIAEVVASLGRPRGARVDDAATGTTPIVVFLCVQNAGRSQMAAGWLQHLAGDRVQVSSGGSDPASVVDPSAVEAMAEVGVDISHERPKPWTDEVVRAADVIVTMGCGDSCPIFPGKRYVDWDVGDPAGLPIEDVRPIRDDIAGRVRAVMHELGIA